MAEFKNELILQTGSGQSVTLDLRNALLLAAAPTAATAARAGMQAYVVSGGVITAEYVCTAAAGGVYTWVKREISGGGGVFTAVYGETAYSDIRAAYDSGMVVVVKKDTSIYTLTVVRDTLMYFVRDNVISVSRIRVMNDDTWSEVSETLENAANKVTEITEEAADTQYPSAKAVYREVTRLSEEIVSLSNYVTPQMYGAVGDGVTDDTAAFTAAIASGDIVFVPKGTYLIGDIAIDNKCRIFGESKENTIIKCGSITLNAATEISQFTIKATDSTKSGIKIAKSGCRIYDNNISGFNIGIELVENVHIINLVCRDCTISGCKHAGLKAIATAAGQRNNILFEMLYFVNNGISGDLSTEFENGFGMYIEGGINIEIRSCVFEYNTGVGLYIGNSLGYPIRGCVVTSPYFEWNKHAHLYLNNVGGTDFNRIHISGEYYTDAGKTVPENALKNRGLCLANAKSALSGVNHYSTVSYRLNSGYYNRYNPNNIFPFDDLNEALEILDADVEGIIEVDGEMSYSLVPQKEQMVGTIEFNLGVGTYRIEFDAKRSGTETGHGVMYVREYGVGGTLNGQTSRSFWPNSSEWQTIQFTFTVDAECRGRLALVSAYTDSLIYIKNIRITPITETYDKITLPKDETGKVCNGTAGQVAVSDGAGGITWVTLSNVTAE